MKKYTVICWRHIREEYSGILAEDEDLALVSIYDNPMRPAPDVEEDITEIGDYDVEEEQEDETDDHADRAHHDDAQTE